jgi:hypothetical protein
MADGFLGRWSRRKQEVRAGLPLEEPAPVLTPRADPPPASAGSPPAPLPAAQADAAAQPAPPPPSLADVGLLTPQSDFKPFVAQGVAPEVKNAAMKKLFADPHYNVMDRLDIYIDDYTQPDPLPASMLRKMASAKFLNLFDEEKGDNAVPPVPPDASAPAPQARPTPDAPGTIPASTELTSEDHAHTDLRLQPNHAAGAPNPGRGTQ